MSRRLVGQRGFTLVEVMIVIVTLAILAGLAIPQFGDGVKDAKVSSARFNLRELRSQIELYRQHHDGRLPGATLAELLAMTNGRGQIGSTAEHSFGPYLTEVPVNPFTDQTTIRAVTSNPPAAASGAADAGWLYHPTSGGIWIDDADHFTE
jgi:prepilin-type N-terminal cleavage/methylation domain-containing protein